MSPLNLREQLGSLIDAEIEHARAGREAGIVAKLNSLVDGGIIEHLYRASPGPGCRSTSSYGGSAPFARGSRAFPRTSGSRASVGRFLEHSRIVCFAAGHGLDTGGARVFISSADWMPRNLDRRVETLVPIENPNLHRQVLKRIIRANLADEAQAWHLEPDGTYTRVKPRKAAFSAHDYFMSHPSLTGRGAALGKRRTRSRRNAARA